MDIIGHLVTFFFSMTGLMVVSAITALYLWSTHHNLIFKRRGVPHLKAVPFVGHLLRVCLRQETLWETFDRIHKTFPTASVVGFMQALTPIFVVRDAELFKQITVKNFEYFQNHLIECDPHLDPVFGRSVFAMKDQKWKVTRNMLLPAFNASKMRLTFDLIKDCANKTVKALETRYSLINGKTVELELKDLFTKYTNDAIATAVLGIEVNSVENPSNEVYEMSKILSTFGPDPPVRVFMGLSFPKLSKFLKLHVLDKKASAFLINLTKSVIQHRIENKIVRPDVLNLYVESLKNDTKESHNGKVNGEVTKQWNYDEFACICVTFFFAGLENTATFLSFIAYELAVNPDVQQKLLDEIDEFNKTNKNMEFEYESLQKLKYLDMVVNETGRKWPISVVLDRKCNKDITLFDKDGTPVEFKQGDTLYLNTYDVQRNPDIYENPDQFIPERFAPENKDNINPYTSLNFGIGPRMCMGARFAVIKAKCMFYMLLSKYRFEMCERTQHPLTFKKGGFVFYPEHGVWLRIVPRSIKT